jgi:DnaJ-class molecular chaperone
MANAGAAMNDDDQEDEFCSWCSGSGEGMYDGATCSKCHGSGVEPVENEDDEI